MIYFTVYDAEDMPQNALVTYLNGNKLRQWVEAHWNGADYYFTSVARARHWADNVVHQNHTGLPCDPEKQGGWRTSEYTERGDGEEHY
jgi:hypothetical protein